jgi:hypothetical protein
MRGRALPHRGMWWGARNTWMELMGHPSPTCANSWQPFNTSCDTCTYFAWSTTAKHNTHPTSCHIVSRSYQVISATIPHSTAQHSTAQHSTAQHSTAQHSTAQHSTEQHRAAQHRMMDQKGSPHTHAHTSHRHLPAARPASPPRQHRWRGSRAAA